MALSAALYCWMAPVRLTAWPKWRKRGDAEASAAADAATRASASALTSLLGSTRTRGVAAAASWRSGEVHAAEVDDSTVPATKRAPKAHSIGSVARSPEAVRRTTVAPATGPHDGEKAAAPSGASNRKSTSSVKSRPLSDAASFAVVGSSTIGGVRHAMAPRALLTLPAVVARTSAPPGVAVPRHRHTLGSAAAAAWQPCGTSPGPRSSSRVPPLVGPAAGLTPGRSGDAGEPGGGAGGNSDALVKQKAPPLVE